MLIPLAIDRRLTLFLTSQTERKTPRLSVPLAINLSHVAATHSAKFLVHSNFAVDTTLAFPVHSRQVFDMPLRNTTSAGIHTTPSAL